MTYSLFMEALVCSPENIKHSVASLCLLGKGIANHQANHAYSILSIIGDHRLGTMIPCQNY